MSSVVHKPGSADDDGQFGPSETIARLRRHGAEELLDTASSPSLEDSVESCLMIDALVGYVQKADYSPFTNVRDPKHALSFQFRTIEALQEIGRREETMIGERAIYALGEIGGRDAQLALSVIATSATVATTKCAVANSLGELREKELGIATRILSKMISDEEPVVARAAKQSMQALAEIGNGVWLDGAISRAQTQPPKADVRSTTVNPVDARIRNGLEYLANHVRLNYNGILDATLRSTMSDILVYLREWSPDMGRIDYFEDSRRARISEEHFAWNDIENTLVSAMEGLAASPGNVRLWYVVGTVFNGFGEHDIVMAIYDQILRMDPACQEVLADLKELKKFLGLEEDGE